MKMVKVQGSIDHYVSVAKIMALTRPQGYQTFHAQLRLKFILLINVKMPTIVGILTCQPF